MKRPSAAPQPDSRPQRRGRKPLLYPASSTVSCPQLFALPDNFFSSSTARIAKKLLGLFLSHSTAEGETIGRIVETEAYLYKGDPACHAARGATDRNRAMFGPAGFSYVYFIYGNYFCVNVVTGKAGCGEAVLIRALEPAGGIELMKKRRRLHELTELCSGPGKLAMAMGITRSDNLLDLRSSRLKLLTAVPADSRPKSPPENIITTTRIGISAGGELPLRFYLEGNNFISRK